MTDHYTPEQAERMLKLLGLGVLNMLRSSAYMGHARTGFTADTYAHLNYPPTSEREAAVSVVVEMAGSTFAAADIIERHPWLPLLDEHYPPAGNFERRAGELHAEARAS